MKWTAVYRAVSLIALLLLPGGSASGDPAATIRILPLTAQPRVEFSSLAWIGDSLLLLPEKPDRFRKDSGTSGGFFMLRKQQILDMVDGKRTAPLVPALIPVYGTPIWPTTQSWQVIAAGFEAAAVDGQTLYLLIEGESMRSSTEMHSWLVTAQIAPDLSRIDLDLTGPIELPQQAHLHNLSYESLTIVNHQPVAFYEVNSRALNPSRAALLIDPQTRAVTPLALPELPARVTDVTPPDERGVFWALSCCLLGEAVVEGDVSLIAKQYGAGALTAPLRETVQLIPLKETKAGIVAADEPVIDTAWTDQTLQQNWEGIAPLDDRGFLIVTDTYPGTLLGFIAAPVK